MVDFHSWPLDVKKDRKLTRGSVKVVIDPLRGGKVKITVFNNHRSRDLKVSLFDYRWGLVERSPDRTLRPGHKTKFTDVSGNPVLAYWQS